MLSTNKCTNWTTSCSFVWDENTLLLQSKEKNTTNFSFENVFISVQYKTSKIGSIASNNSSNFCKFYFLEFTFLVSLSSKIDKNNSLSSAKSVVLISWKKSIL